MGTKSILIEGYTPEEITALPQEHFEQLILTGEPLVFSIGSAKVLGEFRVVERRLVVELSNVEGGGEGVLPTLWLLAVRYAQSADLHSVEWIVHAITCAEPNPKLRRLLERRGFIVRDIPGIGEAFYYQYVV